MVVIVVERNVDNKDIAEAEVATTTVGGRKLHVVAVNPKRSRIPKKRVHVELYLYLFLELSIKREIPFEFVIDRSESWNG